MNILYNTGNRNTGDWNTGNRNTGDLNTGNRNTGDWNTGDLNTGNRNTGNRNTGNWNTGNWNTGNWNTGNRNTGDLNTNTPPLRIFNQETNVKRECVVYPDFFFFDLNTWVSESNMTDKEKDAYPSYVTCGGYLKSHTNKQAWSNSWDKATRDDKEKCFKLPNWNNDIFKEISGIDVEKELGAKETVITLTDIAEKFGIDVQTLRIKE